MNFVHPEIKNGIFKVTLNCGITNPINLETTRELLDTVNETFENDQVIKALLLTSGNKKFFSIGFDIPQLLELDRAGLTEFYDTFNELCIKLYSLPIPTLSAIPGHCIAAGCIIAACTDFRCMADGKGKIGVTATKLGLPVPFLAKSIIHQLLGEITANEVLSTGNLYDIPWAKQAGYLTTIEAPNTLLSASEDFLAKKIKGNKDNFVKNKMKKIESIITAFNLKREQDAVQFIDKWFSPEVQELLKEARKKF